MGNLPFTVPEASSLFMDAYALEGDRWVFGSFWGNETVLQEFFARLTLPNHEIGLRSFTVESASGEFHKRIQVGDAGRLSKLTARTPATTIVGSLCNVWIFDPALQKPDRSSGECYVLSQADDLADDIHLRLWDAIKDLSPLPLLDHWKNCLLPVIDDREWIIPLTGIGVQGYRVSLPAEPFEVIVSEGIRLATLTLQPAPELRAVATVNTQTSLW